MSRTAATRLQDAERLLERLLMLPYAPGERRFDAKGRVRILGCCPDFGDPPHQTEYDELRRDARKHLGLGE